LPRDRDRSNQLVCWLYLQSIKDLYVHAATLSRATLVGAIRGR
jgi:hypothetical protein